MKPSKKFLRLIFHIGSLRKFSFAVDLDAREGSVFDVAYFSMSAIDTVRHEKTQKVIDQALAVGENAQGHFCGECVL